MLRYGIPEYRLPKEVLDEEINLVAALGVEMMTNTKVGKDIPFETIRADFDAVCIGIGAWVSTGVGCKGEDADGVIGGIDFLRKVVRNEEIQLGEKVAIVGGGNTAMDACRTAVRLGAKEVYNIYRRTKDEMPADRIEIEEGEEEGVIFKNLTNPIEVVKDENGHVKEVILQVMELGEPDESGRRRPVVKEGSNFIIETGTVIVSIGQSPNPLIRQTTPGLDTQRWGGIIVDEDTMKTSKDGVYAGGDVVTGAATVILAMGAGKKAAKAIDEALSSK